MSTVIQFLQHPNFFHLKTVCFSLVPSLVSGLHHIYCCMLIKKLASSTCTESDDSCGRRLGRGYPQQRCHLQDDRVGIGTGKVEQCSATYSLARVELYPLSFHLSLSLPPPLSLSPLSLSLSPGPFSPRSCVRTSTTTCMSVEPQRWKLRAQRRPLKCFTWVSAA